MARTKELHVILIVLSCAVAAYFMGSAWPDSLKSLAGGIYRQPHVQLFGSMFGFVVVAFLLGGLFECMEPELNHRHTLAGKEVTHPHRLAEVAARMLCTTLFRVFSLALMGALFGPA